MTSVLNDYLWIKQRIDAGEIGKPVMVTELDGGKDEK